jgi:hypothetical protein
VLDRPRQLCVMLLPAEPVHVEKDIACPTAHASAYN